MQLEKESLYRDALDTQEQSLGDEKVEQWKKAIVEAGKVKGWELGSYNCEGALITSIIGDILRNWTIEHDFVFEDLSTGDNPMLSSRTLVCFFAPILLSSQVRSPKYCNR